MLVVGSVLPLASIQRENTVHSPSEALFLINCDWGGKTFNISVFSFANENDATLP